MIGSVGITASAVVIAAGPAAGPQTPTRRVTLKNTAYLAADTINLTGAVAGRLLVATLAARSSAGAVITPAGWTVIGAQLGTHGTSSPTHMMWGRVATGTEGVTAFWDATYDANKVLQVEEYPFTLAAGLTPIGGFANDSGATIGDSCPLIPAAVTQTKVLWLASVAVRDVITAPGQVQAGWANPGFWDSNVIVADGNTTWMSTAATYVTDSSEPICQFTWTTQQRFRGRVIGLQVT